MIKSYVRKPETIFACPGSELSSWGLRAMTGQKDFKVPRGHWVIKDAHGRTFTMAPEGFLALFEETQVPLSTKGA